MRTEVKLDHGLSEARKAELHNDMNAVLTQEEFDAGWHFCDDWDLLLIHKTHREFEACHCFKH